MGTKSQQLHPTVIGRARSVGWPSTAITQWQRERIAEAGGDPSIVPETQFRFIRLSELKQLVGLSRSSIYREISFKRFPAPVPLSARSVAARESGT
jgi:predicted DNA-binding transcriptional regulator AlpA